MSNLSPNFTLEEFTFSQTAVRYGVDNDPPAEIVARLVNVAHQMERVRSVCGNRPIRISSGFRCDELNALVGGSRNSAHREGWAVDFTVNGLTPKQVCEILAKSDIAFDQLIQEGAWVHISFKPTLRREILTAHFKNGKATYTKGL